MVRPCSCPASDESGKGHSKDKGACHVPEPQQRSCRDRHRYRQKLIPRCRQRGAIVLRQKWSRGQIEARLANMLPCDVDWHDISPHAGLAARVRAAIVLKFSPRRLRAAGFQIPRRSLAPPATEELWPAGPHSATSGARFCHREIPGHRDE